MKTHVFGLESAQDGLLLSVMMMKPEGTPKAVVQILHGMSEHKERYIPLMEYLAQDGYAVIIHDHRGHGESLVVPDENGYLGDNGAALIVFDAKQVGDFIRDDYPDLPFYLIGHSMGSLVARMYLKKYDTTLDGLILSGIPSENKGVGFGLLLTKALMKIKGETYRSPFIHSLCFGQNDKKFPDKKQNAWLSSDTDMVDEYNACDKCGFVFTLNGFEVLFLLMGSVYDRRNWKVRRSELPILFLSGEDDPVKIDNKSFYSAVDLLRQVGYKNVDAKLYPKMRHEILNEIDRDMVMKEMRDTLNTWFQKKV